MPRKKAAQNEQDITLAPTAQKEPIADQQPTDPANIVPIQSAEKPVKGKRGGCHRDLTNFGFENAKPGDNARYLRFARDNMHRPPIDISDDKQVARRIEEYFDDCEAADIKPTVTGMCNAIGVDRREVRDWHVGKYRAQTHSPLIKKAYDMLEQLWEDYMLNGKVNPASGIFLGKNHWGYRDVADVVLTPGQQLSDQTSPEQMQKQLAALPED